MTRRQRLNALREELARAEEYKLSANKLGVPTAEAYADGRIAGIRFAIEVCSL